MFWLCTAPSPYNNLLFQTLTSYGVNVNVYFKHLDPSSHPWRDRGLSGFEWRPFRTRLGIDWSLIRIAWTSGELFLVAGWTNPTMLGVLVLRILRGAPCAVWTDTARPQGTRRPMFEAARKLFLSWLFRNVSAVLATGSPGVESVIALSCPPGRAIVFPYWVALPSSTTSRLDAKPSPLELIAIGRLVKMKRVDLIIRALSMARGLGEYRLTIVGDGDERASLELLVENLGLSGVVWFAGWLEHNEAMTQLDSSHIFVHAADWEPYGVVVLEAMARGIATIASDGTMAALDRIEHKTNGLVFGRGNANDLARCIVALGSDAALRQRLGRNARVTAESWDIAKAPQIIKSLQSQTASK